MSEQEEQREAERYQEWCAERDAHEEQQYYIYLEDRIAELEAQNRIFRNTESVDDSVWDALLEQVRTYQEKLDRVRGLLEKWRDDECRHGEYYAGELEAALNKAPKAR